MYRLFWICCSGFLGLLLFFASCQSKTTQHNTSAAAPPEMERLLQAADTLSAEALEAEARKLPGTWVDSLANAFGLKEDYAKSIECHQKALLLRRQIGKVAHTLENLAGIARMHNKLGHWQATLDTAAVAQKVLAQING